MRITGCFEMFCASADRGLAPTWEREWIRLLASVGCRSPRPGNIDSLRDFITLQLPRLYCVGHKRCFDRGSVITLLNAWFCFSSSATYNAQGRRLSPVAQRPTAFYFA